MDWWIIGAIAVAGLFAVVVPHLAFAPAALRFFEAVPPLRAEEFDLDPSAEIVSIPTTHGLTLTGSLLRPEKHPPRGLIIFCPELYGSHRSAGWYCRGLRDAGFFVLAFDFRNQGRSESQPDYEPLHWLTEFEISDVNSVIRFARMHPELKQLPIGVFGVSRGGGAALVIAARSPEVACVASDSAFATSLMVQHFAERWVSLVVPAWLMPFVPRWHIRATMFFVRLTSQWRRRCRYVSVERGLVQLKRSQTPALIIAGHNDNYVQPVVTKKLAALAGPMCTSLWIVPRAKHNRARSVATEEYDRRIVEFFSQLDSDNHLAPQGQLRAEPTASQNAR